jgi:hypothetical protein
MSTSRPRPHRARAQQMVMLLVATCLTLLATGGGAWARATQPNATISSNALRNAIAFRNADRRALARNASRLNVCVRAHSRRCAADRRTVRRSRIKLAAADRHVRNLSARISRRHTSHTPAHAPTGTPAPEVSTANTATTPLPTESGSPSGAESGSTSTTGSTEGGSGGSGAKAEGAVASGPFEMGVVAGSAIAWEMPFIQKLGAHTAREEFEIGTSASQMSSTVEASARAGVRPLLLASFYGTLPTPAQAQSLGTWAAQFGPGGSFWKGKGLPPADAVTSIEFGNETSYEYQFSDNSAAAYASRAQTYALRFKEAQAAIHAANPNVALLAQGDPGNAPGTSWMDNMFKAVPNLGSLVGGWTVHPYGPNWQSIVDKLISSARADGAPSSIPLDVTEWGLSSDNGRCLDDNYGFNKCMTYAEAATTLTSNLAAMRDRYGSRLASLYLFQARDQKATGTSSGREGYFGALQSNEAPKGAYTATVQSLLSLNP